MSATVAPADLQGLIERIHASKVQLVLEFTGAGSAALAWLHSLGGSSRTIIEATDRYAPTSLITAIGFTPERFTGAEASVALARLARERAADLAYPGTPFIGIGASATIATDRTKKGEHRAVIALEGPIGTQLLELVLDKGARDRAGEEEFVSRLILTAVADGCGLLTRPALGDTEADSLSASFIPNAAGQAFSSGASPALLQLPDLSVAIEPGRRGLLVLSGSFNPLHHGHLGLSEAAAAHVGRQVTFEIPLVNADKPDLELAQLQRRMTQFAGVAPLLVTRAPLFLDKARLFPGSTFIIGADTATRLLDPRFYGGVDGLKASFSELSKLEAQFLVAGRRRGDGFVTLSDLDLPPAFAPLFSALPDFRADISSTELRNSG